MTVVVTASFDYEKMSRFSIAAEVVGSNPPHQQITMQTPKVPKIAVGLLLGILLFGMFMVGFDQGHLFSIAQGEQAYENLWMHEFYHDMRHAAGFPCH
jgi:hypothetical protein